MEKEKKIEEKKLEGVAGGSYFSHDTYRDLRINFLPPVVSDKEHPLYATSTIDAPHCPRFEPEYESRRTEKRCELCKKITFSREERRYCMATSEEHGW